MNEENKTRANRILCAALSVDAYSEIKDDPATVAADILADLRHFCDLHGLQFDEMNARGQWAYLNEIEEQTA